MEQKIHFKCEIYMNLINKILTSGKKLINNNKCSIYVCIIQKLIKLSVHLRNNYVPNYVLYLIFYSSTPKETDVEWTVLSRETRSPSASRINLFGRWFILAGIYCFHWQKKRKRERKKERKRNNDTFRLQRISKRVSSISITVSQTSQIFHWTRKYF